MTQVLMDMSTGGKVAPERITGIQSRMESLLLEMSQIAAEVSQAPQLAPCPTFPRQDDGNDDDDMANEGKRKLQHLSTPQRFRPTADFHAMDSEDEDNTAAKALGILGGEGTG